MATALAAGLIASPASAAKVDTIEEHLRGLSIEDLANVEITSVFKRIGGYSSLDVRIGWHVTGAAQLALAGFNLLDNQHPESGSTGTPVEFRRGVFASARVDF